MEKYMVIGSGTKDGNAYATLKRVVEGRKENGDNYAFIDEKSFKKEAEQLPLGAIYEYSSTRVASTQTPQTQQTAPPQSKPSLQRSTQ